MTWLPDIHEIAQYGGDWEAYEEAVYRIYCGDWVYGQSARFRGAEIRCRQHPSEGGREYSFLKLTSGEDEREGERLPDLRRCERIGWIRPVVERGDTADTRTWANTRGTERNVLIALPDFSYVVVLSHRTGYFLLKTAYYAEYQRRRDTFHREWAATQTPKN
jgi:hypothetical protein